MAYLKQRNDRRRYWVRDEKRIGTECLALSGFGPVGLDKRPSMRPQDKSLR